MARDRASRPEAKPQRLFIAVPIPEIVLATLYEAVAPLRDRVSGARWVTPQNQHLTLKFLGSTWPRLVPRVKQVLAEVAGRHTGFEVGLAGAGAFSSPRRAGVLWARIADPGGGLAALAADLDTALEHDFRAEQRAFTPHLTLARFRPPADVREVLADLELPTLGFPVREIVLFRSHLRRPAPVYERLAVRELGPPA